MKNFNRFKVLSTFFVIAFFLAAPGGMLVALAKGSQAKIHSTQISKSVSIRSMDNKGTKFEMHERKEPKISEVASAHEKEVFEKVEKTSFDDHKSNSNGDSTKDVFTQAGNSDHSNDSGSGSSASK